MSRTIWLLWFLLCGIPATAGSAEQPATAGSSGTPAASCASGGAAQPSVDMNFGDVDIRDFISYVSEVTGTNFIIDPEVKGHVTVEAPTKVPLSEVLGFFRSVLEVSGYTTVDTGGMVKIVPSAAAPGKNIDTGLATEAGTAEDKVVTQVIRLNYLSADDAKNLLTPMASKSAVIVSHAPSGTLTITEFHPNIERLEKIINALDVPTAQEGRTAGGEPIVVEIIALDHADAEKLASVLRPLLTKDGRITAYPPTNTLIIRDKKSLVEQLVIIIKGESAP